MGNYPKNRKTREYKITNCVICKERMKIHTPNKRYCNECRKIHDKDMARYRYENDENHKRKVIARNLKWTKENKERVLKYQAQWKRGNKERVLKYQAKWKRENKETVNARNMASRHIELEPECEICGSTKNLQRHHWRYDQPLKVNTLCSYCHNIQHIKKPLEVVI
ncbi:hypothetical protein LCGC14_1111920 [marine sediment metagenome]|uniref:Uncharacterized protein n=1 Tax=marine sediment metagenome TaxID=412755 RepID=A0A0F9PPL5_9ZZZZ